MFSLFIFSNLIIYYLGGTDFYEYAHKILQKGKKEWWMINTLYYTLSIAHKMVWGQIKRGTKQCNVYIEWHGILTKIQA